MDTALFRKEFPEFADVVRYPNAQINFYYGLAAMQISEAVWGVDVQPFAQKLFIAHNLIVNASGASSKGGPVASKSIGGVSVSYDTNGGSEEGAGWWNLTTYGKQYYRLLMIYNAGVIQL